MDTEIRFAVHSANPFCLLDQPSQETKKKNPSPSPRLASKKRRTNSVGKARVLVRRPKVEILWRWPEQQPNEAPDAVVGIRSGCQHLSPQARVISTSLLFGCLPPALLLRTEVGEIGAKLCFVCAVAGTGSDHTDGASCYP